MGCILEEIFANLKGKGGKQMDTIKIGKFLAENRKKKKLTQEQDRKSTRLNSSH